MTAQVQEALRFRGKDYGMAACPLEGAFHTLRPRPAFVFPHTACWRGYVGTWEVRDDRLHLVDLAGQVVDGETQGHRHCGLADVFPEAPSSGGVFADWVTDWLRVPDGEMLHYVHMGFGSQYERDLFLGVHLGRLVAVRTVDNRTQAETVEGTSQLEEVYPEEAPFIRAALADPTDDLPKLVYADWLDEHEDPRGQLLRMSVERANEENASDRLPERYKQLVDSASDRLWPGLMGCPLPSWWGE